MAKKVGNKIFFKRPSKKAVKFNDDISSEHVAVLLSWFENFSKERGFEPLISMDDLDEALHVINEIVGMTVKDFESYFETERGKGFLTGLIFMAIGYYDMEIAELEAEEIS